MTVEKNNGDIISFFKRKDYIMVNNALGNGSFGKTVVLKDPYIDEIFVAKKYEPEYEEIKEEFYKNFLDEIKILHRLNHPNVVRIFGYYPYEDSFTSLSLWNLSMVPILVHTLKIMLSLIPYFTTNQRLTTYLSS